MQAASRLGVIVTDSMAGRLNEAEIALAKGDHAEAARVARVAIDQSREVQRAKYELAAA